MRHPIGTEIFAHPNHYPESHDLQLPRTHPSEIDRDVICRGRLGKRNSLTPIRQPRE